MKLTTEQADRLKKNLVFDNSDKQDIQGAITILFRGETNESTTELYRILQGIAANADMLIGLEFELPEFGAEIVQAPKISDDETAAPE